jgi:hypothetical protein
MKSSRRWMWIIKRGETLSFFSFYNFGGPGAHVLGRNSIIPHPTAFVKRKCCTKIGPMKSRNLCNITTCNLLLDVVQLRSNEGEQQRRTERAERKKKLKNLLTNETKSAIMSIQGKGKPKPRVKKKKKKKVLDKQNQMCYNKNVKRNTSYR